VHVAGNGMHDISCTGTPEIPCCRLWLSMSHQSGRHGVYSLYSQPHILLRDHTMIFMLTHW
jgi:hypothetical protein